MILSRHDQPRLLHWAALQKGDGWWPDAQAIGIYHKTTKPSDLCAVVVLERIGRHTADVHIKSDGRRRWASRRIVKALFSIAFDTLDLNRMEARIATGNVASLQLVKRLGFRLEATLRDGHGPGRDAILAAITRKDCRWITQPVAQATTKED